MSGEPEPESEPEQVFPITLEYFGPGCTKGDKCNTRDGFAYARTVELPALTPTAAYTAAVVCRGLRPTTVAEQARQGADYSPSVCDMEIIRVLPEHQLPSE